MAQKRPDLVAAKSQTERPPHLQSAATEGDPASIDQLLALTDEGWDIDAQVRTLQIAADEKIDRRREGQQPAGPAKTRIPTLILPTAFELAPASAALSAAPAAFPAEPATEAKPPSVARSGRPPPLPARGSKAPPAVAAGEAPAAPLRVVDELLVPEALHQLLAARIETLEVTGDKVGLSRAYLELAIVNETLTADDAAATRYADAALRVDPHLSAAHALLRRRKHGRAALGSMLSHLDHEIASASEEGAAVELLAEKARLLDAKGGDEVAARSFVSMYK